MGAVILPSRETRYYDRLGNEITGFGSPLEAARFAGDPTQGLNLQSVAWPKEWSGRGALPGGAVPTGRKIRNPKATPVPSVQATQEDAQTPLGLPFRVVNAQRGGVSTILAPFSETQAVAAMPTQSRLNDLLAAIARLLSGEPL